MADEIDNELSNEAPLEGGDELFSGIDGVLGEVAATEEQQSSRTTDQQLEDGGGDALSELDTGTDERPRGEDGKFKPKAEAATEKDKPAAEKTAEGQQGDKDKGKESEKTYPETIKSPKARHEFDNLRQQRDDAQRKADGAELRFRDLEKRFKDLESKSGTASPEVKVLQQKIESLEKEREELDRIVSFKAVEETKAFREGVSTPQTEAMSVLRQVAETYQLDGIKLDAVLQEPNRFKRLEMLGDLTEGLPERAAFVKDELKQAVDKWVSAGAKAAELYENAKGNREFAEQEKQQSEATTSLERQKEFRAAEKEVIASLSAKLPELAGDEAVWKEIQDKAAKVADFDKMPAKGKAFAHFASYMIKPLITQLRAEKAERQKVEAALAARAKTQPGAGGGREATTRDADGEDGKSFFDVLNEEM